MIPPLARAAGALLLPLALGACGQAPAAPEPASAEAPPVKEGVRLPTVDTAAIQANLPPDTPLETVDFAITGKTERKGIVEGDKAPVYAVPVAAGQSLAVTFIPGNTNLYMNISDAADTSGAAVHRGEVDGAAATLKPATDTVYLLKPYQPRAMARRGEKGDFSLTIDRH